MQKKCILFILLLSFGFNFSQTKIAYIKDIDTIFTKETIKTALFQKFKNPINNGLNNGVYWFKISNIPFEKTTIQIPNSRIRNAIAYQESDSILPSINERFTTFETTQKATLYLKVNVTREALIPITIQTSKEFSRNEKKNFLFLGFYYGFAFVIVLINLFYFTNFKDTTFLYYALFLLSLSFGLSISDGILNFLNFSKSTIAIIEAIDHFFVVVFALLFTYTYLQVTKYYSKVKIIGLLLTLFTFIFGGIYIVYDNHLWYVFMEIFVFSVLIYCWVISVSLFSKNIFTKIFAIAYFFILMLGLSFYITKLLGIPITISATKLKFGAFFEMVLLSFAVIYRMKILQDENIKMREDIVLFSKEIQNLSEELQKTSKTKNSNLTAENLTIREQEILQLIIKGASNKEIGGKLNISINTVKYHVKNIYDKLHIKSRREVKNLIL